MNSRLATSLVKSGAAAAVAAGKVYATHLECKAGELETARADFSKREAELSMKQTELCFRQAQAEKYAKILAEKLKTEKLTSEQIDAWLEQVNQQSGFTFTLEELEIYM